MNVNSRTSKINFTGFASGAIASFTGLREAPIKIRSYINAIQEGSGDPAPDNIRPIIGVSECNVVRCGKNLINVDNVASINVDGNGSMRNGIVFSKAGTYTIKSYVEGQSNYIYARKISNGVYGSIVYIKAGSSTTVGHLTIASGESFILYDAYTPHTLDYSKGILANCQVELGSTDTDYHAYTGNTYTIQLGDTYYGGSLDVTTGVLTVTHANIASYNGEPINEPWICSEAVYSEGTTPPTGSQVVYELATPFTVQLTPTQVEQLLGANNVFADCGNVEVYYVTI